MADSIETRVTRLNWSEITRNLDERGYALTPPLLTTSESSDLIALYSEEKHFRNHIVMARYRFGSGDYKYFADPLPATVRELRQTLYPQLSEVANTWNARTGTADRFPSQHQQLLKICHQHAQTKPTPLLLHYQAGDYNCLHQDLYGEIAFPLQLTCFLSRRGEDYRGGEFVLTEQQPRAQSKVEVIAPEQGQVLIFTTRYRPVKGARGYYRVNVRHGVSRVHSGVRYTLGIIFHDAQ
jgi:hypothetical protein